MDVWSVILDVVLLLGIAMIMGLLFERFRQSAIVAYLLTGALVGPGMLGLVRTQDSIRMLAELGVALLLFTIGLEFSWKRMRSLGVAALAGGAIQITLTGALVFVCAILFGATTKTAVALGAIIGPSSTACVLRVLSQRAELDSIHGRTSLGILLFQDVAVIPLILLVTALGGGNVEGSASPNLVSSGIWVILAGGAFYLLVTYIVPHLLDAAVLSRNRELPILFATATCLAAAWGAHALHLSPALGAFMAGVLLAESPYATWIRSDVSALRTLFLTLFFASIGMLDDPRWIHAHWPWLVVAVPSVLLLKSAIVVLAGLLLRIPLRFAVGAGLCLAQIGEFSFVLATVAETGGAISTDLFNLIVATAVLTMILTPYLIGWTPRAILAISRIPARQSITESPDSLGSPRDEPLSGHVIIVGFGPAGRGAWNLLRAANLPTVVVDLNRRSIAQARTAVAHAVIGDATQEAVLEHAHVAGARAVLITLPDRVPAMQIIAQVRILAPQTLILARARYDIWHSQLKALGVIVVNEEQETGRQIGHRALEALDIPDTGESPAGGRDCAQQ